MAALHLTKTIERRGVFFLGALALLLLPQIVLAQSVTVTPITWNIIGLDSNNVNIGPNRFPVGARVCATGALTNVVADFVWDSADPYINLRSGSSDPILLGNMTNECKDAYFEVELTRDAAAYDHTRNYHIAVTADGGVTGSTPTPRVIKVEHLISQSRNAILDIQYGTSLGSLSSVASGGTLTLEVGKTYFIKLVASTATQGYEQLESFINFPNTVFQILSVATEYSAPVNPTVGDTLYTDACTWENDPNSPNYLSCLGTGKAGGSISIVYEVTILSLPSTNPEPLSSLVHDFSGSSFHYNADYDTSARFAEIVSPLGLGFTKEFTPNPTSTGGISNLTFTISNPFSLPFSNISFDDTFLDGFPNLQVAAPATVAVTGCGGSYTFAPSAGDTSISFSGGSVAAFGTCIVAVRVTPLVGSAFPGTEYDNMTDNLIVDGTDTGLTASDTLVAIDGAVPPTTCTYQVATWNMTNGVAFENTNPPGYTTKSGYAATATATYSGTGTSSISTTLGNPVNSWGTTGGWAATSAGYPNANGPYFEFTVDTTNFTEVHIDFDFMLSGNWANSNDNHLYVYSAANGGAFTNLSNFTPIAKNIWFSPTTRITANTTGSSTTTFRINPVGQQNATARLNLDNVIITGCRIAQKAELTKSFFPDPISTGGVSTLTFTLLNRDEIPLTGVTFVDNLPAGMEVAPTPNASTNCGGTPTWAPTAGATTLTFGSPTGATLASVGVGNYGISTTTCTAQVDVTATAAGVLPNISDFIFATESLFNTSASGSATDTLTVVAAPEIAKLFEPNPILQGGTSTLTFTITNPNPTTALASIAFTDTYPAGVPGGGVLVNTTPLVTSNTCGGTLTAAAGGGSIALSGVSLAASTSCTVSVNVTTGTADSYLNSVTVSHVFNAATANGNTATDTLVVTAASPSLSFQKQINLTGVPTDPWFSTVAVSASGNVWYRFTVENTGDVPISGVTISDLGIVGEEACTFMDPLPVADAFDDDHIGYCIVGPIAVSQATFTNTASASGTYGITPVNSNSDIATYETIALTMAKSVVQKYFTNEGQVIDYQFTVTNAGAATLSTLSIDDDQTTDESCPSFSTAFPGDGDNFFDSGEVVICTASHTITADDENVFGFVTNIASAVSGTVSSATDTATITHESAANYGHLPTAGVTNTYPGNTFNFDGASHITGGSYLGGSVPTEEDGTDGSFAIEGDDNGITPDDATPWTYGVGGGALDADVTCASGTCYLAAWVDWNRDGDFDDAGELISGTTWSVGTGTSNLSFDIPGGVAGQPVNALPFVRFRLYESDPGAALSPYAQAIDGTTGAATVGEVEDYFWEIIGGTVTPVTISFFSARPSGNGTSIEWSTSTETANIGFNIYVRENGRLVKLNDELLPSQSTDSLERRDYSFYARREGTEFVIEEVSVYGETRQHGSFDIGEAYGSRADDEKIDWASVRHDMQSTATRRTSFAKAAGSSPALSIGLKVDKTGIYRLTYEGLRAAGIDLVGTPTNHLAILNHGNPVPVYIEARGSFGPGSYIEFQGEAIDTIYTNTNYYTLVVDQASSVHMPVSNALPGNGLVPPPSYDETTRFEVQRAFANYAPGDDAWYDTSMLTYKTPKSWNFNFDVNALAGTGATASMELVLWGVTDWLDAEIDHHVVVSVNGARVADELFGGLVEKVMKLAIPAGVLREGTNTLTITLPGDSGVAYDLLNLDKFSVTYPRAFQARNGLLTFSADAKAFRVTNLPSANVSVYRSDGDEKIRMRANVEPGPGNTFMATFAGSTKGATYFVSTAEWVFTPAMVASRRPVDLDRRADYLIISHPSFISGLQPLVAARQAQGLTVSVVDVDDLYAHYTYGVTDPGAIRQHIAHAVRDLGARFVLLVGGDTYDYKNFLGKNSVSFIPSLYATTSSVAKFVPVDPRYADLDGDDVPDVALGRFPVRTAAELDLMVRKTLAYESKIYPRTATFVSDKRDPLESFKNINAALIGGMPPGWTVERIDLDDTAVTTARTNLIAAMNRGTALVTFTGHSGPSDWTLTGFFKVANVAALTNAGRPFVVTQWGCWNTYYVDPANNHLVHAFLFSGDKGAAAVLGASTRTSSRSEKLLGMQLTPRMTTAGMPVGQALLDAKKELAKTRPNLLDVLLGWTLMGDPALVIEP